MLFGAFRTEDLPDVLYPKTRTLEEFEIVTEEFDIIRAPYTAEEIETARPETAKPEEEVAVSEQPQVPEKDIVAPEFDEQPRPQVTMMIEVPTTVEGRSRLHIDK